MMANWNGITKNVMDMRKCITFIHNIWDILFFVSERSGKF